MPVGVVKWFNPKKGYGFISPEDGSKDAFVHITAVQGAGLDTLNEGDKIEYELVEGQNGKRDRARERERERQKHEYEFSKQ